MKHRLTASLLCLLAACSSVAETGKSSIQANRKETQAMSDTETAMTPKQLLTRLLKLMETSDTVDDFTPEKISKTFGVPLEKFFFDNASPPSYGFRQKINSKWYQRIEFVKMPNGQNHLNLKFNLDNSFNTRPDMNDVCEMTAIDFFHKAKDIGFSVKPVRALGRAPILEGFALEKGKLRAHIRLTSGCIESIRIR